MYGPSWSTRGRNTKKKEEKKDTKDSLVSSCCSHKTMYRKNGGVSRGALALLSTFYDNIDGIQKAI